MVATSISFSILVALKAVMAIVAVMPAWAVMVIIGCIDIIAVMT